jgi:hypothetical protein
LSDPVGYILRWEKEAHALSLREFAESNHPTIPRILGKTTAR